jgi:uncharacterized coiled-coil DUF342 family protein
VNDNDETDPHFPKREAPTSPDASKAPLLPPRIDTETYLGEVLQTLLNVHAQQMKAQNQLHDPNGTLSKTRQEIAQQIRALEAKIDERDRRAIERDRTTVTNQELVMDKVDSFRDDLQTLNGRVNSQAKQGSEFNRRLNATGKALDDHDDRFDALEHRVAALEATRNAITEPAKAPESEAPPAR